MRRMFKCLCVMLILILISVSALAEVDTGRIESMEDASVFLDDNGIDTVIRPNGQPYFGEMNRDNVQLCTYLDFVEMPDMEDTVFIRMTFALETWETIGADRVGIRVGKENYVFEVSPHTSEYDMTYYEDYVVCLTDKSLPMLKAMASGKTDTWEITFYSEDPVTGLLRIDRAAAKKMYNLYVDAKGSKQNLESFRDIWPCIVEKTK
jgi:hypothetical protein